LDNVLAFVLAGVLYLFVISVIKILAPGFDYKTVILSADLFRIGFIKINAIVAATLFTQYLNYKKCFYPPMISTSIGTSFIVAYLLIMQEKSSITNLMLMTVVSYIIQVVWLIPFLFKYGLRPKFYINCKDANIKLFFVLSFPAILNYMAQQIGIIINQALASKLQIGSISALAYANSIVMMINMTVSLSIATIIYPYLAETLSNKNIYKAITILRQGLALACIVLLPATVGLFLLGKPISTVMFERGAFTAENTKMTATALGGYAIGILGYAFYELANRFFYSLQDTKTPMIAAYISVFIMTGVSFMLYKPLQVLGLSLSASVMQIAMALILLIIITTKYVAVFDRFLLFTFIKAVVASFIMGLVLYYIRDINITHLWNGVVDLAVKIFLSIFVYTLVIFVSMYNKINWQQEQ